MAPVNISVPWVCKLKNDDEGHGLVEEESDFNDEFEKNDINDLKLTYTVFKLKWQIVNLCSSKSSSPKASKF